jgi:uncharacterized protein
VSNSEEISKPSTPCINVCKLDEDGVCIGCFRTIEEISSWSQLSEEQRQALMQVSLLRQSAR